MLFLLFFALILLGTQPFLGLVDPSTGTGVGDVSQEGTEPEGQPGSDDPEPSKPPKAPADNVKQELRVFISGLVQEKVELGRQLTIFETEAKQKAQQVEDQNQIIIILNDEVASLEEILNLRQQRVNEIMEEIGSKIIIISELEMEIEELRAKINWPPIMILDDDAGYRFETRSAEISESFGRLLLEKTIPKLEMLLDQFGESISAIEVVGHTDQQQLLPPLDTNLDRGLLDIMLGGKTVVSELEAADNAGLGLARAAVVANFIELNSSKARAFEILPLSGAQLITPENRRTTSFDTSAADRSRRRIEIRLRGDGEIIY